MINIERVINTSTAELIKKRRLELGLSQQELAEKTNYSSAISIDHLERGLTNIPRNKLSLFSKVLGLTSEELNQRTISVGYLNDSFILNNVNRLNDKGIVKVQEYINDLLLSDKYRKG